MQKLCTVLLLTFSMVGCVSNTTAPQSFYYILDAQPISAQQIREDEKVGNPAPLVKVLPINLPEYLNQPNLVLKLSNHQIKIANYHFWAEDLSQGIQRVLINTLNNKNNTSAYTAICLKCTELLVTIDHFYPTEQGDVVLSGSYQRVGANESPQQMSFSFTKRLDEGGYDEAVAAMRSLLNDLVDSIN